MRALSFVSSDMGRVAAGAIFPLLAACAPMTQAPDVDPVLAKAEAEKQHLLVIERQISDRRRLNAVAFRIFSANADLCEEKNKIAKRLGLQLTNSDAFPGDYKIAAEKFLGFGGTSQVIAVAPSSPAFKAGLREKDLLLSVNGKPAPRGKSALKEIGDIFSEQAKKGTSIELRIRRENLERDLSVDFANVCDYAFSTTQETDVNAFADGKSVQITSGMMRFAATDEELATVVGHELAHNLMGHIDSKRSNAAIGMIFDILAAGFGVNTQGGFSNIAAQAYSQEFETEADYVGLYLMARAGYETKNTPAFWRRMGVEHPSSIRANHAASHPSTPYRYVSLEKTAAEIARKHAAGLPLRPEMKKTD